MGLEMNDSRKSDIVLASLQYRRGTRLAALLLGSPRLEDRYCTASFRSAFLLVLISKVLIILESHVPAAIDFAVVCIVTLRPDIIVHGSCASAIDCAPSYICPSVYVGFGDGITLYVELDFHVWTPPLENRDAMGRVARITYQSDHAGWFRENLAACDPEIIPVSRDSRNEWASQCQQQ
jgi:hypothetical protein